MLCYVGLLYTHLPLACMLLLFGRLQIADVREQRDNEYVKRQAATIKHLEIKTQSN
jgi:hypothetical protein